MDQERQEQPFVGTGGWWLLRTQSPLRRRARKDGITEQRITAAALRILETDGHDALTMRRIAQELGTGPASIYRHVASREELTVLVVDHVLGLHDATPPANGDWRQTARWGAGELRRHLLAHPAVVPLITSAQMLGPNSMRGRDFALRTLISAGFSPHVAVRSYLSIVHFTVACVQLDLRTAAHTDHQRQVLHDYFAHQDPTRYPEVVTHADVLATHNSDAEFTFGLNAILDGISLHLHAESTTHG